MGRLTPETKLRSIAGICVFCFLVNCKITPHLIEAIALQQRMSGDNQMPRLNLERDGQKLSQAQLFYMRLVEQQNMARVAKLEKIRKKNIITGSLLGIGVLAIYGYTIYAVKQEKFLDELD